MEKKLEKLNNRMIFPNWKTVIDESTEKISVQEALCY